ncbi:hypothetical protein STA3757_08350 [Stanieria sp. NIES-3757]|nr:hypothetical protein STA3757_08350 [Stanieria sp. NIES-3757]
MTIELKYQALTTSLLLCSNLLFLMEAQARPKVGFENNASTQPTVAGGTTFSCIPQGNNYATVGQKADREPVPLIVWTPKGSNHFGEKYPPQTRCQIVTQKLNAAINANGGTMKNLLLTNGMVNSQTVICTLRQQENACNPGNTLFTLKPENASRSGEIISQLMQIGRYGSSAGFIQETSGQVYVDLGDWENKVF